jgi:hypothetical protein
MSELSAYCESKGVKATVVDTLDAPADWGMGARGFKVRLSYQGRTLTVPFYQGAARTKDPTAADVLRCIMSDARAGEQDFESFCGDFGYHPDSRKAEATWRACRKVAPKVRRLLGADFESFESKEH